MKKSGHMSIKIYWYLQVKSSDADSGANAEIEYYVSDDHFTVNANGVISNNKKLDADSNNAYYEFTVTAKGTFILSSKMLIKYIIILTIQILNSNTNIF